MARTACAINLADVTQQSICRTLINHIWLHKPFYTIYLSKKSSTETEVARLVRLWTNPTVEEDSCLPSRRLTTIMGTVMLGVHGVFPVSEALTEPVDHLNSSLNSETFSL